MHPARLGYLLNALRSQCPIFFAVTGECGSGRCQTARLGSEHREHNGYHKGQHRTEQQIITDIERSHWHSLLGVQRNSNRLVSARLHIADVIGQQSSCSFGCCQNLPQSRPDLERSGRCRRRAKLGPVGSGAFFLTVGQRWSELRNGSGNDAPRCC